MIRIEPLGVAAAPALAELASRPEVTLFGDHRADAPAAVWARWLGPPDPHLGFTLGAFDGDALKAVARVRLRTTRRRMHAASLDLIASGGPEADEVIDASMEAALDACDRWLQVARCELRCPPDHPRIGGIFAARGFHREALLRASVREGAALRDEALLGRIREGVEPAEPLSTSLRIPPRRRPSGPIHVRLARPSDGPAIARTMSELPVVWGTLQLPFQRRDRWNERLLPSQQSHVVLVVAEVRGELAGSGALTLFEEPRRTHAGTLGMQVATGFQGQGVGTRILDTLLEHADRRGLVRVELSVYPDNDRARRLYEHAGFELEGRCRLGSFRDGTWVDELIMARIRG